MIGLRAASVSAVAVIVPARNEENAIVACLDSIAVARQHLAAVSPRPISVSVAVVLDRCTDRTADRVASFGGVQALITDLGQVGAARAHGSAELLSRSSTPLARLWLANTDADSTVPPHWLSAMVAEADRGADVVLGTVTPDQFISTALAHAWRSHHIRRDGHPHVHGANFGIRASSYLDLGGWSSLATGEDVLMATRATAAGHLQIVRSAGIEVTTSSRLAGRAPLGFANYLRELADPELLARPAVAGLTV
jgi:hypothetical protein